MSRFIFRISTKIRGLRQFGLRNQRSTSTLTGKPSQANFGNDGPSSYLLLAIPAGAFCLGTWQVYRREWKLGLIKHLEERTSAPPSLLPENLEDLENMEYCKFVLRGKFSHDKELLLGPRSLISKGSAASSGSGLVSSGQSGYNIVTPFKLTNSNLSVLVNRGWLPRKKIDPSTRSAGQVEDEITLIGVYRRTEKRPQFVPQNQPENRMFHYRDVESMARLVDSAPLFFDADEESTIEGGPIGGQTVVTLRNEHFSYIITWYSLAIITAYLWHRRFVKKLPLM